MLTEVVGWSSIHVGLVEELREMLSKVEALMLLVGFLTPKRFSLKLNNVRSLLVLPLTELLQLVLIDDIAFLSTSWC